MQLKYWKNINPPVDGMQKISALTWSPNYMKLAVGTAERVVYMFNEQGEKKDKFPTKPSEKGQKSYVIRALEFSPDSQKIAVAQSDNIVFIYKIGLEWGDRKSICNKFPTPSSVTCMVWPKGRHNEIVFGLAEGKVRMGVLKSNKHQGLYSSDSYCVSMASSRDGEGVISGHLDGSIYVYNFETQANRRICVHHSVPYALGWGEQIVAAGNDGKVSFYDAQGNFTQRFDYTNDTKVREFTVAACNPGGDTIVLGNFNRFYVYNFNKKRQNWEEIGMKHIENYYTVTALVWKNDGSKLVSGSLCGSVDIYNASMQIIRYKGKFEINYVSASQAVVRTIATGNKCVVKSEQGCEITRINILQDRYIICDTMETIILCDMESGLQSEVAWHGSGNEKYDVNNPGVCLIFNAGELTLVEYGNNEILGTCRTEFVKSALISVRVSTSSVQGAKSNKVIGFLLDQQTICIQDLNTNSNIGNIQHDTKIDFVELNAHATKLLFRDKRRQLYLYNLKTQQKSTMLNFCNYAQWVPDSEVVVAQNRMNLCVWYSIENPDKVTIYNIKGDVESIQRVKGKTEVIVTEGANEIQYELDEPLIEFGFAIEARDLEKAASILDPLDMNPETEANWKTLAQIAVECHDINVAEHCYAALGDISKAAYLRKLNKMIQTYKDETGKDDGVSHYKVQAKLAALEKQFHRAEAILVDHNEVQEAMLMYEELHKWDESIKIAEMTSQPELQELKENYFQWLLNTNQEGKAAEVKEKEGQYQTAINLYLKGGLPAKAANVVFNYSESFPQDVLEKIAATLVQSGMFERAGEFYEQMEMLQRALDCYCKGNAFKKAVELAKQEQPSLVVTLEERWGDWLVSTKQTESAVNHYVQAACHQKAIEAAIQAKKYTQAVEFLQAQPPEVSRPFYVQIAKHYSDVRQYDLAEKYYIKGQQAVLAFEMYTKNNKWDQAYQVAKKNMAEQEIVQLYIQEAQKYEKERKFKEAEKLYLTVEEPDQAIQMYKTAQQYDNMIRLVAKYRRKLLKDTHMAIARKLQQDGNFKQAETHFIDAGAWSAAVDMYRQNNNWEDAVRVSRVNGSEKETCELAKKWLESLGEEKGMKVMQKMGLADAIVEYYVDKNDFNEAFKTAQSSAKHKISDVHIKYALHLEDEKRYKEAEEHFKLGGQPQEAISMYEHMGDFHSALQIARQYDTPQNISNLMLKQAKSFIDLNDFAKAEATYIQARKPDMAVQMYRDMGNINEAIRVARKVAPHLVQRLMQDNVDQMGGSANIKQQQQRAAGGKGASQSQQQQGQQHQNSGDEILQQAKLWEEQRQYKQAIDVYLDIQVEHFENQHDVLEKVWERVVHLTMNYDKENVQKNVRIVCKRLCQIKQFEQAAAYFEDAGLFEEAVNAYIQGGLFERGYVCVAQIKNPIQNEKLTALLQQEQKKAYLQQGNVSKIEEMGEVGQALELIVQKGDWAQCLQMADKNGPVYLNKYLMKYIKAMLESDKCGEAVKACSQYGITVQPKNYPLYKTLLLEVFHFCREEEVHNLRITLKNFYKMIESNQSDSATKEFKKFLYVAHLYDLKNLYLKRGVQELAARCAISLLRYCDIIRLDKLYYDAGMETKKMNWLNISFMVLNRYLDIYEVIEDPETNTLVDNPEFAKTDIPSPYDVTIPDQNIISEKQKEELGDWLLQMSIDKKVQQELPTRKCEFCNQMIFDACVKCPFCKNGWEVCILTGYPLLKTNTQNCKSCGKGGVKEYWTIYQSQFPNCAWCGGNPN